MHPESSRVLLDMSSASRYLSVSSKDGREDKKLLLSIHFSGHYSRSVKLFILCVVETEMRRRVRIINVWFLSFFHITKSGPPTGNHKYLWYNSTVVISTFNYGQ